MSEKKLSKNEFSTKNQHSLANSKMHKYNICPECGSERIIKYGVKNNKKSIGQRYLCKNCSKIFVKKVKNIEVKTEIPQWTKLAYNDFTKYKISIENIEKKYNKSYKTIIKYFNLIEKETSIKNKLPNYKEYYLSKDSRTKETILKARTIILSLDGTFFK